ncbi:unnamed protein product [Ranitomeya imitator]|uniref:Uncharacterized protein n=1 Tax=Ranitomeya imitator TaxID=111125 RepID=A0ABN9LJ30_9NEOB|nr:unnamed protein product [Ranitomeya imitator]
MVISHRLHLLLAQLWSSFAICDLPDLSSVCWVSRMSLTNANSVQYTGDPLQDFTLMRFLDRFVYRNPKQPKIKENNRGYLIHQKKKLYMNQERQPVNSVTFLEKEESEIPVDEIFFHRYRYTKRLTNDHHQRYDLAVIVATNDPGKDFGIVETVFNDAEVPGFFKKLSTDKPKRTRNEDEECIEDVDDDEFEKILDSFEGDSFNSVVKNDLDFAGNLKPNAKSSKKTEDDSDSDWDVDPEDEDEEISLGSMCEEDFEADETGGVFMDTSETSDTEQACLYT